MTSPREEVVLAREGQEAGMETDEVAVMLGDGGRQIVIPEFPRHALQGLEGMDVAAHKSLEALAVGELHVKFATVALDQAEGIELARIALVQQRSEMPPVDFKTFAGGGLHAHIGALGHSLRAHRV